MTGLFDGIDVRVGGDDHRACLGKIRACSSVYVAVGAEARTCGCSCMLVCVYVGLCVAEVLSVNTND